MKASGISRRVECVENGEIGAHVKRRGVGSSGAAILAKMEG